MPPRIVQGDVTRLPELEPLWGGLHARHSQLRPPGIPVRAVDRSWSVRRTQYERWLASAIRFYEREDFEPFYVQHLRRL